MALVKIKQIDGLTASLAVITTNATAITNLEASVDSLEDIVALGTGALEASVDSLEGDVSSIDTRVLAAEGDISDLSDSVDSLEGDVSSIDTRIGDVETALTTYFKDDVATGYISDLSNNGPVVDTDGTTSIASYDATNPAAGQGRFTLVEGLEGTNAAEWERNLLGVFINGVKLDPTEVTVQSASQFSIDAPYAFDENDILEIRYNKAG